MEIGRLWMILLLRLLGTCCQSYAEREYTVTVLADPPNDPYQAYSGNIQFTCLVDPLPPEPVTYEWKTLDSTYGDQRSGQNMTFYPDYSNLRFSWFFCHVFSNSTLVKIGYRMVEIHGIFSSAQKPVQHFTTDDNLTLSVRDISQYYSRYVSGVRWYHNGSELTTGERFMISSDTYDRELNITDLHSSDAGTYQVKINSLSIYGSQDPACDSSVLPLAENHAAFAPVTFVVRESSECKIEEYNSSSLHPPISTHYFVDQDGGDFFVEETIHVPVSWNSSTLLDISSHQWFHNGQSVSSDGSGTKYNTSFSAEEGVIRVVLAIRNFTENDSGHYTVQLLMSTSITSFLINCRYQRDYRDFFFFYLNLYQISVGMVTFKVEEYKPPVMHFSVSQSTSEGSSLECSVGGGNPSSYHHNIKLVKNGSIVMIVRGDHLSYNVSNMFGVYTCVVESLHSTNNKTLLIPERVTFQILVDVNIESQCEPGLLESQHRSAVLMSIMAIIEAQCDCNLSVDSFEGSRLTCLGYGSNALFTSTLVYSDSEGKVLASNLVGMLQSQLEVTNGQTPEETSFVFLTGRQSTSGGIVAGVFVGGWIVGLLTVALAIWIGACILKIRTSTLIRRGRDSTGRQDAYATSEDMKMASVEVKPNTAYEAVCTRHQARPSGRLQETVIDEPVYDIPEP